MHAVPEHPSSILDAALEYAALGLSVIPLGYGTKRPKFTWKEFQRRRPEAHEIERWFRVSSNIGIITGAVSTVVVIDCDCLDSLQWVIRHCGESPMLTKTAKGFHCYFRHPGRPVRNGVKLRGLPLDIRGDGGYVVAPPSVHESGFVYEKVGYWSMDGLPTFNPAWVVDERKPPPVCRIEPPVGDMVERARAYIATIEGAISGQRGHDRTFRIACILMQRFGLSIADALPLMHEWNQRCEPPWTEQELLHKLQDAFEQRYRSTLPPGS